MASSVPGTFGCSPSVASVASPAITSIRPAWVISVSAETLSAPEMALSTRTEGWCRPRSPWLRYGLDRLVSSASWRSDRLARLRCSRMKAPSASRCASHGSVMAPPPGLVLSIVRESPGVPGLARTATCWCLLGAVLGARGQRARRLEDFLGELALAGQELLGEVVGASHDLLRLGQLVRERHVDRGDLRGDGLDGLDPGLEGVDDALLALADRDQNFVLQVLRGGASHGIASSVLLGLARSYLLSPLPGSSGAAALTTSSANLRWRVSGFWAKS